MKAALKAHGCQGDQACHGHCRSGAQPAIKVAGFVLGQDHGQAKGGSGCQRKGDATANLSPLASGTQARGRTQHIKRHGQPHQDDRHGQQDSALWLALVE